MKTNNNEKTNMLQHFLKGIVVGIGGIAPGLSGSVLMVILGLYSNVINAIANIFKDFKKNFLYLLPIGVGMVLGIVIFSRLIKFSMTYYEIQTRLAFFGLIIGTIPLFYKEVTKKNDVKLYHYALMLGAFLLGLFFLTFSTTSVAAVGGSNILQSFILGFVGISAMIIPGLDGASILSALGLYGHWLDLTSLRNIDLAVYIPAGIGVVVGGLILSAFINFMLKKQYTTTFSVLFGFFLSILPNILKNDDGAFIALGMNTATYIGIALLIIGIIFSYFFSKLNQESSEK